jgi:hypothetical protein
MPGGQAEPATPAFGFACPAVGVAQLPRGGYLHGGPHNRSSASVRCPSCDRQASGPVAHQYRPYPVHAPAATGPPGMLPAQLTHCRLHLRADLMRARLRAPRAVHQPAQATLGIAANPGMHALPRHPEIGCHLADRNPSRSLQDSPVTLLDNRQLHQCQSLGSRLLAVFAQVSDQCEGYDDGGQGRGRTADLPLFRRIHSVAVRRRTRPDRPSSWGDYG